MFVTCGNCDAEYELDDAKIPVGGARLRCTNCEHSFVVTPPEASDIRSADDLAHDALTADVRRGTDPAAERKAAPEKSFGFDEETDLDPEFEAACEQGFDVEADPNPEIEVASEEGLDLDVEADPGSEFEATSDEGLDLDVEADPGSEFEAASDKGFDLDGETDPDPEVEVASGEDFDPDVEADWEFNEEVESSEPEVVGDAPEPPPSTSESPPSTSESPFDQGDDWSDLSTAEDVVDDLLGSGDLIEADPAAAVDDLLGDIDTTDSQFGESDGDLRSETELPSESLDLGDAPALDGSGESPAADASDSFEDLADWEIFDPPAESGGSAVSAGPKSRSASGARAEPQVGIAVAMAGDVSMAVRWTDRVAQIAGWGVVCLLMSAALVGGFVSHSSDASATLGNWSGAGFEADQIVGRWVDNAVAGSIYVVSGRVRRAQGSDRAVRKVLGILLIDTKGRKIDRAPIPLAPAVPERVLRESSPAELDAFQLRRTGRIAAVGERWVSFEAVLTDLPQYAGRFELQALDR